MKKKNCFYKMALLFVVIFFTTVYTRAQTVKQAVLPFNMHNKHDINKLVEILASKRIVALGEDTHGTKEYYELRSIITKKLIEEKGYNVFILENPHEDMMALQDSFYTVPIESLIKKHLFSIYQTEEMRTFLVWLKKYNKKRKVAIAGCDDSYREILPAMLKMELQKYKDSNLSKMAAEFENRQNLDVETFYALPGSVKYDSLPDDIHYGYETYLLINKIDSLYHLQGKKNSKVEELIFHVQTNYEVYQGFIKNTFLSRDAIMGNRVNYYARNKNAKIIVWANNAHISKLSLDGEIGKMGEAIAANNKNQYAAIGFCTGGGNYSYLNNRFINNDHAYNDTLFDAGLMDVKENTWNAYLNKQTLPDYLINFAKLNAAETSLFAEKKPMRFLGYRKENPAKTTFQASLSSIFDMLIFIRKTDHTTPLFFK